MRARRPCSTIITLPVIAALCLGCANHTKTTRTPESNQPSETALSSAESAAPSIEGKDVTDDVPDKCKLRDDRDESSNNDDSVVQPNDHREVLARLAECVTAGLLKSEGGRHGAFSQLDRRRSGGGFADARSVPTR